MKLGGLVWSFVRELSVQGSMALTLLALAFFLGPKEFGLIAIAAVWLNLLNITGDLGFAAALIQRKTVDETHLSSVFVLNIGLAVALCLLGIVISEIMGSAMHEPQLTAILPALASSLLFYSISLVPQALARKRLMFKALATRDTISVILAGFVAVAMAYSGLGIWAFVGQVLVRTATGSLLIWFMVDWRPRLTAFRWSAVIDLWDFSSALIVYSLLKWMLVSIDKLFLGYLLGPIQLGYYSFAERAIITPTTSIRNAVGGFYFPVFSMHQDNVDRVQGDYNNAIRMLTFSLFPLCILFAFLVPSVLPAIFGARWAPSIPICQLFAGVAIIQAITSPVGELMKALNKPRWLSIWSLAVTGIQWTLMLAGLSWGIVGVAAGLLAANVIYIPMIMWVARKLIRISYADFFKAVVPGAISAGAIAAMGVAFSLSPLNKWIGTGVLLIAAVPIMFKTLQHFDPGAFVRIQDAASRLLPRGSR